MPVLVIWGEPDLALDTELAYLPAEYFVDFQVKLIKDTTHFVLMDKPKEFNAAMREFLANK